VLATFVALAALVLVARLLASGATLAVAILIHTAFALIVLAGLLATLPTLLALARLLATLGALAVTVEILVVILHWSNSSGSPGLKVRLVKNGLDSRLFRRSDRRQQT
jgi:apolipoprotein N-acyltransferase